MTTHPLFVVSVTCFAIACTPAASEECFVDAQCPAGMACLAGQCGEPEGSTGEAVETTGPIDKLDLGGGVGDGQTCASAEFVATNAGCEFWATDLPNVWAPSSAYSLDIAAEQTFAVVVANVSAEDNAEVSVFAGAQSDPLQTATVGPLGTYAFLLPNDLQIDPTRTGRGRAFRVESDRPITAYQFQPLDNLAPVYSNDASALLPVHVLGTDYVAITSNGYSVNLYPDGFEPVVLPTGAYVTVVATEDTTQVAFFPTDALLEGDWQGVVLDRGETFTLVSNPQDPRAGNGSLSGTRVISDRPLAAFSGNIAASVPETATECCLDHVEHQLLPTVAWGARYVTAPPPDALDPAHDDPVEIRLVGAYDDTPLVYPLGMPAGAPTTIDAHRTVAFSTTEPVIVESADPDKPFALAQYLYNAEETNPTGVTGDPSMIVVPSVEQLMDRYVFLAPYGYATSTVTVVAPHGAEVRLDDKPLGDSRLIGDADGVTWGYRRAKIDPGAHVVSSDEPIGITVVGYDRFVSYAYAGGSAVAVIHDAPPAP